jgi:hypothetical protein
VIHLPTLVSTYWSEVARQATLRGKPSPTKLDREVAHAVLSAGLLALEDMQQGHRVHRTLASATGSGKSSMAACLASALLKTTDVPVLFVCPDIKMAEDTYFELVKLIDPQDIVIWTSGHDAGTDLGRIRSEQGGFEPKAPRFWKSDLERRKLSIVTHRLYIDRQGERGLGFRANSSSTLREKGYGVSDEIILPRLHLIDERLNEVTLTDIEQSDITEARDAVHQLEERNEVAEKALIELHRYLDRVWMEDTGPNGSFKALSNPALEWFVSRDAWSLGRYARVPALRHAVEFGRSLVAGRAFMARYPKDALRPDTKRGGRFVAYSLDLPIVAGSVLMDGTSDIDGVNSLVSWRAPIKPPMVTYDRLSIKHVPFPVIDPYAKTVKKITASGELSTIYANWLRAKIVEEAQPGESVLLVTHKQMVDQGRLPRADFDHPWDLEGRKVAVTTYGRSVGSNAYKTATTVILAGEHYKPQRVTMGEVKGFENTAADDAGLAEMANVRTRHKMFTVLKNGHLLLWAKQLAMRGTARNFDGDGVCGAMKLVAIGDFDLWFNSHEIMFPGARFEYSAAALKGGGLAKSLADFILAHPEGGFDSREACEACGIRPANFARTLKTPVVGDALKRTGLVVSNTRPVRFIQFKDEPPLAIAAE